MIETRTAERAPSPRRRTLASGAPLVPLQIACERETYKALKRIAVDLDSTMRAIVVDLIRDYVQKQSEAAK